MGLPTASGKDAVGTDGAERRTIEAPLAQDGRGSECSPRTLIIRTRADGERSGWLDDGGEAIPADDSWIVGDIWRELEINLPSLPSARGMRQLERAVRGARAAGGAAHGSCASGEQQLVPPAALSLKALSNISRQT